MHNIGDEGIFGFKDQKPATFNEFEILIGETNTANVKEFELLAADDSAHRNLSLTG